MTRPSRNTITATFATIALALLGGSLVSSPSLASGWRGGHGGHGGWHGHRGPFGHRWNHGIYHSGFGYVDFRGGGDCFVVHRRVFVRGVGFVSRPKTICE